MTVTLTKPHSRSADERLAADIARLLLPQRYPHRRDVELSGCAREWQGGCSFYDAFRLSDGLLALASVRIARPGMAGALRAAALHRLVRAGLSLHLPLGETLGHIERAYGAEFRDLDFDLALLTLDCASGTFAGTGRGHHAMSMGSTATPGEGALPIGPVLWIAAGADNLGAWASEPPEQGMDELVARAGACLEPGVALVGLTLRRLTQIGSHHFSMANDLSAIAGLLSGVEKALERESVPEAVGAGLALALDELLTNTVSYGFPDGGWHEILVDLAIAPNQIDLTVRDDGRAFDPLLAPEPDMEAALEDRQVGGLGIHFVRTLADALSYERERGWNVLKLTKRYARETEPDWPPC